MGDFAARLNSLRSGPVVAASFGLDLIWRLHLLAGVESVAIEPGATEFTPLAFESYPWSHRLAMVLVRGVLAGAVVRWRGGDGGLWAWGIEQHRGGGPEAEPRGSGPLPPIGP